MKDLIYIVGSGRSGSTVIERVLNTSPMLVGIGEVHALWRLPIASLKCSCGAFVPKCAFWQSAFEHAKLTEQDFARLAELEHRVVRNRHLLTKGYDLKRIIEDSEVAEFLDFQHRLFGGIRAASGAKVVLDSSKAGPRAWILAAGLSPELLHTYRGAEAVISSWRRPKFEPSTGTLMKKPPMREAALDWIKVEQAARSLAKKTNLRRLDYRHFASDPYSALEAALSPDFPELVETVAWIDKYTVAPGDVYHSVLGNPDRFSRENIVIQPQHAADRSRFGLFERMFIKTVGKSLELIWR